MIIKNSSTRLVVILSILLFIPFVQKQWFNLYLFNINDISFYSILYYLSGIICPSLICLYSLNNYTHYRFNKNKLYLKKAINGKFLLLLVSINLIFLSYLIVDYIYINIDFICKLFAEGVNSQLPDIFHLSLFIFLTSILLIFSKSRLLLKKFMLVNFLFISFYIWHLEINNINVFDQFHIYRYFGLNNINLINVLILFVIEISYFTWSFLSYKNNLSDWSVNLPQKIDLTSILNIFMFYFFIIIYYSIFT